MTEIAVRHATLPEKIQYAKAMAESNLLPRHYQKQPANLLIALEYAEAFGISPINAISSVFVIDGKPSASADLIAALVRRAGHKLRVTGDDTQATAEIIRADDPDFTYTATWDMEKARKANLTGKGTWKSYPGALLRARAITEVARMGASDALFGCIYTPEEIGADVTEDGTPLLETTAAVEVSGRDWLDEAIHAETRNHLRALWREADAWGELTDQIKARITELSEGIAEDGEVVEPMDVPVGETQAEQDAAAESVSEDQGELPLADPWQKAAS